MVLTVQMIKKWDREGFWAKSSRVIKSHQDPPIKHPIYCFAAIFNKAICLPPSSIIKQPKYFFAAILNKAFSHPSLWDSFTNQFLMLIQLKNKQ